MRLEVGKNIVPSPLFLAWPVPLGHTKACLDQIFMEAVVLIGPPPLMHINTDDCLRPTASIKALTEAVHFIVSASVNV